MSDDIRYMSELFRIISGALRLDSAKVRNYAKFLAERLEADGEKSTASRLRKLLQETESQLRPADITNTLNAIPVDSESRFSLLEKVGVQESEEEPIILSSAQKNVAAEFLSVAKSQVEFETHRIGTPLSLLLYGPPGCGKSRMARHIAKELGRDLYVARLDGLISSFLGSTSKNIRAIFQFAARTPCVLLLDEFDAIAKLRDDKQELGELKRVVTSFLQSLDSMGSESIVIAATNHHALLDTAVWRRFSYTLELNYPGEEERLAMWWEFLADVPWSKKHVRVLSDLTEGFSGAEIREVCFQLRRKRMLQKAVPSLRDAFLSLMHLASSRKDRDRFLTTLSLDDGPTIIHKLKERNSKLYSHAELAALIGKSKATTSRWQSKSKLAHA